nr:PEPxxWA-CTERM sorting domain-containing protein [Qipengyuania sediminis]
MKLLYAAAAVVALLPAAAAAQTNTASGSKDGLEWTASSNIVGQNGTGTLAAGGNPEYFAPNRDGTKNFSGSVGMLMTYANGSQFVCSGSLLTSGKVLTAAHCVSNGAGVGTNGVAPGLVRTQVLFMNDEASNADAFVYGNPPVAGVTAIDVASYSVHFAYTGQVIDQNDIAVLTLSQAAPAFAQAYDLYLPGDNELKGEVFNVNGFGTRSITGGIDGTTGPGAGAGPGRRREGDNLYDYRFGDAAFNGFFTNTAPGGENFFGSARVEYTYVSDFDRSGFAANSQSCRLASALVSGATAAERTANATALGFCTNGLGLREVGIAGGDSGGGAFINGQLASVNSFGLTFGTGFGDFKPGLNDSWGEMNGFVPTFIHRDFIAGVPEPGTWAMMILGFGFVGGAMRRRGAMTLRFA